MEETANSSAAHLQESADISLGTIGLLLGTVGTLLTCGMLAPVGLAVSLFALKEKPRKSAIAGVIVGSIGVCVLGFLAFAVYGIYFMPAEEEHPVSELMAQVPLHRAEALIEGWRNEHEKLPSFDVGQRLIDDIQDRWGRPVLYLPINDHYVILSAGEDGELETADDVMLVSKDQ